MHAKLLAISAAVLLMSSSVTASLGDTENLLGGVTGSVTNSDIVYPVLALTQGNVGGLRRRKVNDLANGPRYGFPATEKKAEFSADKRSILKLLTSAGGSKPQGKGGEDEEEEEEEEDPGRGDKRSLKALRRRKVARDLKGAGVKAQMGLMATLDESQKLVAGAQTSANKIVGQVGRTADGVALSLSEHPTAQSKTAKDDDDDSKTSDQSSTKDATTKKQDEQPKTESTTTPAAAAAAVDASKKKEPEPETNSQPENTTTTTANSGSSAATDNLKMNPDYMSNGTGDQTYHSGSDFNGGYFDDEA